jgi:probable F420-dependent oxidoreductase
MAQTAEAVGFDSIWVADHLLYRDDRHQTDTAPWEAWSMLAALAAVTERIALGPLVACTAFHNPAMIAKKAETIDEISGGRLILGLGSGWNQPEFDAYGFPFDHRFSRFAESFEIIRSLLRTGHVDFSGTYYSAPNCTLLPRGPRPHGLPILLGTKGEQMLRQCAAHADGWNAWYAWFDNDVERLPALLAEVDAACAAVRRDPASLERSAALLIQLPEFDGLTKYASGGVTPITGSPEDLADCLHRFADLGIAHVQIVLDPNTSEAISAMAPVLAALDRS